MKTLLGHSRRAFACAILLAFLVRLAIAAEINIFALQGPGQATVVIDDKAHVAHLIDLGKSGDGDKLELNGKPILEALRTLGIEKITITCSHPHADHHGGFKKILAKIDNFTGDGKKYFGDTIPIIESGLPQVNSLASILKKTAAGSGITVEVRAPSGRNTYRGFSSPDSEVFIETIPYQAAQAAGVHGRSIVTRTTLANRYVHLDFDDADSAVIRLVTARLKAEKAKIDSFIVPHHGSAAQDIDSILELEPKTAIISVDPLNRYGHPAPEILLKLMKALPKEQVVFTGAREGEGVVITPEGVTHAPYTAKNYDSFALFVLPSMVRATGKRAPGMDEAYREIWSMMSDGRSEPPEPPSAATVKGNPKPPRPPSGGSVAVADQISVNGTMHSVAFDAGTAQFGFVTQEHSAQHRVFTAPNDVQALYANLSTEDKQSVLRRLNQMSKSVDPKSKLLVSYLTDYGVPDLLRSAELKGGMVDLKGDTVFMGMNAQILVGGTVIKCPAGLCLAAKESPSGKATSFRLPFSESVLAAAVWDRTARRGLDQLYLSIDPTSRFLKDTSAQVPSDELHFGPSLPAHWQNNRVVTHGDIDTSVIGKILWEADVAFKSESLRFNVLTGVHPAGNAPRDISVDGEPTIAGYAALGAAALIPRADRWCRMFWESGEQRIVADTANVRIRLDGRAVVAQGEAMELRDGKLVEYPSGDWCEDSKEVAKTLEARANSRVATGTLKQLRDLAEMQNFWRWAGEHTIAPADDVRADFEKLLAQDGKEHVPVFTSGVKSIEPVLTQYQQRTGYLSSQVVHIRYGDFETLTNCVRPRWLEAQQNLRAQGLHPNLEGTWEGDNSRSIIDKEMRAFAKDTAICAHGIALSPLIQQTAFSLDNEDRESEFGFKSHLQPIEIHGGVLLGKSSKVLREVVQEAGALDDLKGRPLYRQDGKTLHFWSVSGLDEADEIAEHVEVRNASLIEAYPSEGTLNFLIRANSDSLLRHELRQKKSPVLGRGLEWAAIYPAPGETAYWQKAAWPCVTEKPDCSWVADVSSAQLDRYLTLSEAREEPLDRLIGYERADDTLWIVRVNVSTVEDYLLSLTKGFQNNPDVVASVARGLAWWGFDSDSHDMAERSQDLDRKASEAEDYTAAFLTPDQKERQLLALYLQLTLVDRFNLLGDEARPEATLNALAAYERKLKRLPVAKSAEIWAEMTDICEKIDGSGGSAQVNKLIEVTAGRYATAARVAELMER